MGEKHENRSASKTTILVATDFSKPGKLVVPYAFKLALALNLRLIILRFRPPSCWQNS